ncbi:MAG TPA: ABC transporter permease [Symbiobacteriaceae bacterium]|nr:ABC transporter permease [Symbiobacteriaceae bacterium]
MMRSRWWYLLAGGLLVGAVLFVAIYAERVTPVSPYYMDERTFVTDGKAPFPPGGSHPLGTDQFGRDIWSRVAYGTRWSLLFAGLIMAGRLLLAFPLGIAAAFGPRFFSWLVARFYVFTSAVPPLVVYLAILSVPRFRQVGLWPSVVVTVALLSLVEWPRIAIYVQGRLEDLSNEQFVEGAVAAGATRLRIFSRHLMPHLWATLFQLIAAEMGRGLLVIAQLGIFGIWVGGGITELVDYPPKPIIITGIPEWGTLLAEARNTIRNTPWIPMAPAMAFLVGVVGFHLLSQGLDGLSFSLYRVREATTSRVSKWWRLALIPLVAIPAIYWWQVRTRDDTLAFAALAEQQTQALTNRDLDAYIKTLSPADPDYRQEQRRWLDGLAKTDYQVAVARPVQVKQSGYTAKAEWALSFGYETKPPVSAVRGVHLQYLDGAWYLGRGEFQKLRGFDTDTYAVYDPIDGAEATAQVRWEVRKVSTLVDRAFVRADKFFPQVAGAPRPRVYLFRNHEDYKAVAEADLKETKLSYIPGEAIRVSPDVLRPYDPWEAEDTFVRTLIQALTYERMGRDTFDPIATGAFELKAAAKGGKLWVNIFKMEGRLPALPELFEVPLRELSGPQQSLYVTEAAILMEYLEPKLPGGALPAEHTLAALARTVSMTEAELTQGFDAYLRERLLADSMLSRPEWRSGVPMDLVDAMTARAAARSDGEFEYQSHLIDVRVKDGKATVLALERLRSGTAWTNLIVNQEWTRQKDGRWQLTRWSAPANAGGR